MFIVQEAAVSANTRTRHEQWGSQDKYLGQQIGNASLYAMDSCCFELKTSSFFTLQHWPNAVVPSSLSLPRLSSAISCHHRCPPRRYSLFWTERDASVKHLLHRRAERMWRIYNAKAWTMWQWLHKNDPTSQKRNVKEMNHYIAQAKLADIKMFFLWFRF